jgi:hypothetical protein
MNYVATQIVVWMLLAALFGFAVGWMAKGRGSRPAKKKAKRLRG